MRIWSGCLLAVSAWGRGQERLDLTVISKIEVQRDRVVFQLSKAPTYAPFTLTRPPRLVLDFSDAVFDRDISSPQLQAHPWLVNVQTATFGGRGSAIARIIFVLKQPTEVEFDLKDRELVVRTVHAQAEPVVVAESTEAVAQPAPIAAPSDDKTPEMRPAPELAAKAPANEELVRAEKQAAAQEDAKKREQDARERRAAEEERNRALQEAQALARREAAAQAERTKQEEVAQAGRLRLEREAKARLAAEEQARERQRQAEAAAAETLVKARREAEQQALKRAEIERARLDAQTLARQRAIAEVPKAPPPPERVTGSISAPKGKTAALVFVGFRVEHGRSKVFIRTDGPVNYALGEANGAILLTLDETRIRMPNNQRFLDTSFFHVAVQRIEPRDTSQRSVVVQVTLREKVAYRVEQKQEEIAIEFSALSP